LGVAIQETEGLFDAARRDAADPSCELDRRVQAVRLVGRGWQPHDGDVLRLAEQLIAATPQQVQRQVVDVLGNLRPADLPRLLLEGWSQHSPEIRPQILDVLLRQQDWTLALLDQIEQGDVAANEIGAVNRSRLILHSSSAVRSRAAEVLQVATPAPRQAVLERYRKRIDQPADATHGREVFRKHCAQCHQLEGEGTVIGPDLLALTDRSADALLVAVLDPNLAVEPRYVEYSAITQAGRIYSGIIASERGNSVTILDAQGESHALLRGELDELISTGKSLMPVGAEELMNQPQDLLDLIAYLRSQL
jgi:putative heme-binding domain-containing protein